MMDVIGLKMEDTELNLGLGLGLGLGPGKTSAGNKRGFSETVVDLKLNLKTNNNNNSSDSSDHDQTASSDLMIIKNDMNKTGGGVNDKDVNNNKINGANNLPDPAKPPAKAQVVGWPPVRSYRKNMAGVQKSTGAPESETEKQPAANGGLVKVSMDGAPYLRKVDFKLYKSYHDLSHALGKMFSSFTLGNYGAQGMIDFMNESKLMDLLNGSDYAPTYEDKDGDWMLVGDVPWEMFVESCKRLRIMKGKEAAGLAPRAMKKCKNRI